MSIGETGFFDLTPFVPLSNLTLGPSPVWRGIECSERANRKLPSPHWGRVGDEVTGKKWQKLSENTWKKWQNFLENTGKKWQNVSA